MLKDKIILGIRDEDLKKKLLSIRDLDLSTTVDMCQTNEQSAKQSYDLVHYDPTADVARLRVQTKPYGGNIKVVMVVENIMILYGKMVVHLACVIFVVKSDTIARSAQPKMHSVAHAKR